MAEKKPRVASRNIKTKDARSIARFLEELGWLLDSHSNLDFKALANRHEFETPSAQRQLGRYTSRNPNIQFLVGTLPIIFNDDKYFVSNEDIVEFASQALNLPIGRWEKRSRYELIGLIVCETAKLNDQRLERLVDALSRVTSEDPNAQAMLRTRKDKSLSWNEIIQSLTKDIGNENGN